MTAADPDEIPARFLRFVSWLGVTLTPAQETLCAVAFDGAEPGSLPPRYRELARQK